MICSSTENPRLLRMETYVQNSEIVDNLMSLQYLDWDNQSIFHEVIVHHAMEDINTA